MIEFEKFELANGLRVIVHPDSSTPLACMNILYDVGSRDESEQQTGFAHLFEHLMFGGSENIPNYDEPLQQVGGENNAFTTHDITNYYLTLPADNLETGFWLESDRMLNLAFSDKSLEVQRSVVIEEFKQRYLNQPYGDVWLLLRPLAYKKHSYKWDTIGKEIAHIEEATMSDVKAFFKKFYVPNNAILVVAGDVTSQKVRSLCEKWFAPIKSGEISRRSIPVEPVQTAARKLVVERDVPVDAIYKVFHMCGRRDANYYTVDLLADIIGFGNSSRLYKALVKEQKIFNVISAYVSGDYDPGLLVIAGKLNKGVSLEVADEAILLELEKIRNELVMDEELVKVQNKVEALHTFGEVEILGKATNLAISELLQDAGMINNEVEKYLAVTSEDIKMQANEVLREENSSTLYYKSKNTS